MSDGGPPAPQPPPVPPVQPVVLPAKQIVSSVQLGQEPPLNWSHFKPELAGKPDEDAEAHLLITKDWMDTRAFQEGFKVQGVLFNVSRRSKIMV